MACGNQTQPDQDMTGVEGGGEAEKNLDTFKLPSSLQSGQRAASLPFLEWNRGKPTNNSEKSLKERKSCCSFRMKWKQLQNFF